MAWARIVAVVVPSPATSEVFDATSRTHLGSRHNGDDGVVTWSEATTAKTLELITSRTRDAVAAYLDGGYVTRMIRDLETVSGTPVTEPDTTIRRCAWGYRA